MTNMNISPSTPDTAVAPGERAPKVVMVLLNWNGLEDTLDCLRSISVMNYPNYDVIVIDNASDHDPTSKIAESFPSVEVIRMESNLGYAGGNNEGIKRGIALGGDYFWLLNNDAIVYEDTLSLLIDEILKDSNIGLVSPVIYNDDSDKSVQCVYGRIDWDRCEYGASLDLSEEVPNDNSVYLWGTALLISKPVVDTIGLLNEKYFAYAEDRQYCVRANEAGFSIAVVKNAAVVHKWAQATGGHGSPIKLYLAHRNNIFFWKEFLDRRRYLCFIIKNIRESLSRALRFEINGLIEQAEACDNALWNGLIGNGGGLNEIRPTPWIIKRIVTSHKYFWVTLLEGKFISWLRHKLPF